MVEARADDPILPLRLFRSSVFSVCVVLAFIVGFAMLGAMTFLPTYLQYVKGVSATAPACGPCRWSSACWSRRSCPAPSSAAPAATRSSRSPAALIMALGLFLLSRMDAHTSYWIMALDMLVLGIGIGLCMQVLTIIVQNTVDYRDLGVATSGVTFFRTLGQLVRCGHLRHVLRQRAQRPAAGRDRRLRGRPPLGRDTRRSLHACPAARSRRSSTPTPHAIHVVFLAAVPVALLAFVLALFLKEVPLRDTSRAGASDVGEAFGMPEGSDSASRCRPRSPACCANEATRRWRTWGATPGRR